MHLPYDMGRMLRSIPLENGAYERGYAPSRVKRLTALSLQRAYLGPAATRNASTTVHYGLSDVVSTGT